MATRLSSLSSHNIQTIVPKEVHKELKDIAYTQNIPLNKLVRDVLTKYVEEQKNVSE